MEKKSFNRQCRNTEDRKRLYCKQPYADEMDNLEETDKFLEKYKAEPGRHREYEQTNQKEWNWNWLKNLPIEQKSRARWLHEWIKSSI